jgi:hypothetical protein
VVLGLELGAFTLRHSTSPFLWRVFLVFKFAYSYVHTLFGPSLPPWRVYRDRVSRTISLDWLQTLILLISASWVARITAWTTSTWL